MPELLTGYRRVRSPDPDEARLRVGEVFCPHRLDPVHGTFASRFNSVALGAVGLSYLAYGAEVRIRPQPLRTFVLVQIPLSGRAVVRTGADEVHSHPGVASVPDPDAALDMRWGAGNAQLIVRMDRDALGAQLARLLGRPPSRPWRCDPSMDLGTPAARSWLATVELLRTDLDGPGGLRHPAVAPQVEQLVLGQFLAAHRHSAAAELAADDRAAGAPRVVRRAEQLIVDHAREALTVADVAEAVGLSVRALQEGFARHLGTTPTARLREARLVGVRTELLGADPARTTVSSVAAAWGFWHLSRFAVAYRQRWGESPSTTLRG